jgi:hypothetical protein
VCLSDDISRSTISDQNLRLAVTQNEGELLGPDSRIHNDEYTTRLEDSEHRNRRLDAVRKVDHHTVATGDAQVLKRGSELFARKMQGRERQTLVAAHKRHLLRGASCRVVEKLIN